MIDVSKGTVEKYALLFVVERMRLERLTKRQRVLAEITFRRMPIELAARHRGIYGVDGIDRHDRRPVGTQAQMDSAVGLLPVAPHMAHALLAERALVHALPKASNGMLRLNRGVDARRKAISARTP